MANIGGFSGLWAYPGKEARKGYPSRQISVLSLMCVTEGLLLFLMVYYHRYNRKKEAIVDEHPEMAKDTSIGFRDLTDNVNIMFRYSY
ncbi:hypothetical protein DL95DRAFT_466233 [Leptodontidium sp. 2 PMI_412]|nr:hypothetical protein DL95DRAFT_466233 [Leptodontidium sp. 2 PMI_412]